MLELIGQTIGGCEITDLLGVYCAGGFGPADITESQGALTPRGCGWHVMFTALTR